MNIIKKLCEDIAKALPVSGNGIVKGELTLDAIALGEFDITLIPAVERDADSIPVAWRIFKYGKNELYKNGEKYSLDFSKEVFDAIITHFRNKGNRIPLDSHHFLYRLAEHYGVSEEDVLKVLPDGQGTFGFGDLEKREDGLWITNVEYVPIARKMMADGTFRYFSPVVRGLSDGRFRVTSVTMENVPAMTNIASLAASENLKHERCANFADLTDKIDVIAASAERENNINNNVRVDSISAQKKETSMKNLLIAIAGLIGMDSIAMSENEEAPKDVLEKIKALGAELPQLRADKKATDDFLGQIRGSLALGAEADLNAAQGAIIGLVEKAGDADKLKLRVDAMELSAENDKKAKLIEQGKASGQLSEKMVSEWADKQDSAALGEFLKHAPAVVPMEKINKDTLEDPDSVSLSEEDKEVAGRLGISEEDMLKEKQVK